MQTWCKVELPRLNLYKFWDSPVWGNHIHYREIKNWCTQVLPRETWSSFIDPKGRKIFLFKDEKSKFLFLLRWGTECK